MNYFAYVQSLRTFTRQQQPWSGLCPATGCVPLGGSAAGAQGGDHV